MRGLDPRIHLPALTKHPVILAQARIQFQAPLWTLDQVQGDGEVGLVSDTELDHSK